MKLYYDPASCALSPHIVLREAGLPFELERVDLAAQRTQGGADFGAIKPKGFIPVLELDDGSRLTEGSVIVQYIADLVPEKALIPPAGSFERYRVQEWLSFVSAELHRGQTPLFEKTLAADYEARVRARLGRRFAFLSDRLATCAYLMGEAFTVADAYCFTILNWAPYVKVDHGPWPAILAYRERVAARPAVQAAMRAEGLIA
ncbi:MAG: glutathione transferase GstA [Bauldia litoralis]